MAKKRPPGWKKHEKQQDASTFKMTTGEEAQREIQALFDRMDRNPENFGGWGYFDSDGNEFEDLSFLNASRGSASSENVSSPENLDAVECWFLADMLEKQQQQDNEDYSATVAKLRRMAERITTTGR